MPPDRIGDPLLHKHGLLGPMRRQGNGHLLSMRHPGVGQNPFNAAIPVILITVYRAGLHLHGQ